MRIISGLACLAGAGLLAAVPSAAFAGGGDVEVSPLAAPPGTCTTTATAAATTAALRWTTMIDCTGARKVVHDNVMQRRSSTDPTGWSSIGLRRATYETLTGTRIDNGTSAVACGTYRILSKVTWINPSGATQTDQDISSAVTAGC
ncbi:hypothetical protein [Kribbella deserti]|uniref:Secreted protein n=1 Tax=Kribbella deserti TaxID=1926257 RepID=A0ABV6QJ46_9ACTN